MIRITFQKILNTFSISEGMDLTGQLIPFKFFLIVSFKEYSVDENEDIVRIII